jgi:tetratricopeptide (TPR) repeat protein
LVGATLAAALTLVAFLTTGGTDLGPNTSVEIAVSLIGAMCAIGVVVWGAPGRAWGGVTLLLFAALAAMTFASIAWSVQPDNSWEEANRTLSYLAAFGAAIGMARLFPGRWPAVLGAVGVATTAICAYALLVKVFPATFDPNDLVGRLKAPFGYWNATGLVAALGLPACIWAGARPAPGRILRALSMPAIAILLGALVLAYSRGALVATVIAVACWFVVSPIRLRGALILSIGAVGGAVLALWALEHHPLTGDGIVLSTRTADGHTFGIVIVAVLVVLTAAGFAAVFALDRVAVPALTQRRIGTALLVVVALMPLAGVAGIAVSSRGLTGEVSHLWHTVTNTNSVVTESPGRLVELSNSRPRYWHEGLVVGEHALLAGTGAGGFLTARTHYSSDLITAGHAHSYLIETFADLGLLGIALSLALLAAWLSAAARTVRPLRTSGPDAVQQGAERLGMITMLTIVLTFGIHSAIDWTWFFPGVAIPALICAGWVAGRGPLDKPIGRTTVSRLVPVSATTGAVVAIATIAIATAWIVWQPFRSSDADASAVTELLAGNAGAALTDARTAADTDPVSADALWELSEIYIAAGDLNSARGALVRATSRQPSNPETWQRLGEFDVRYHHPQVAVSELVKSVALDLTAVQPLWDLAAAYSALQDRTSARAQLVAATARQPRNPQTFQQLAEFDLRRHAVQAAVDEVQTAIALGAQPRPVALLAKAKRSLSAQQARQAAAAKAAARRSRRR